MQIQVAMIVLLVLVIFIGLMYWVYRSMMHNIQKHRITVTTRDEHNAIAVFDRGDKKYIHIDKLRTDVELDKMMAFYAVHKYFRKHNRRPEYVIIDHAVYSIDREAA